MRLLLDTHIFLWLAKSPEKLSAEERSLFERADAEILISAITIWELRIKWNSFHPSGDRKGVFDPLEAIAYVRDSEFELTALMPEDCATTLEDRIWHGDPFDEMLLVHAQRLDAKLLTRDRFLREHPLAYRPV